MRDNHLNVETIRKSKFTEAQIVVLLREHGSGLEFMTTGPVLIHLLNVQPLR
jgi:hypothetical protein